MASGGVISGLHWGHMDLPKSITGSSSPNCVRKWLTTTVTEEDAKQEPQREATEPLRRNASGDDDLDLGVEASLYGKQGVRTVQDFLRWSRSSPTISRWNSFNSTTSGHSGQFSVMDILNLWNDDPEEVLLDLGFGCDEPDLSGRIPARFINYQSQARGINLQVFLEAQKNRMDLENPDVSNRFRQLEVLQQVTTAFSSLMGSSSSALKAPLEKDLPPDARERRRRMGMLFRRASKKSLSQMHNQKAQDQGTLSPTSPSCAPPVSLQTAPVPVDKKVALKRLKTGNLEAVSLSPLAEEHGAGSDPQVQAHMASFVAQEGALRPGALRESHPLTATTFFQKKKGPWQPRESFEMEEIHSFDEGSVTGSSTAGAENIMRGLIRTNSCQSDSSGFLEEPFIPSLPLQGSPGSDLIKALSGLSGGSTDSHNSERPGSPSPHPHRSTTPPLSSSLTPSDVGKVLPSSQRPSPELSRSPTPPPSILESDLHSADMETLADQEQPPPASLPSLMEHLPPSSSSEVQVRTHSPSPTLPSSASFSSDFPFPPMQPASVVRGSEKIDREDKGSPCPHLSNLPHDSEDTAYFTFSSVPPTVSSPSPSPKFDCSFSASADSSGSQGDTQSECIEVPLLQNSQTDSSRLSSPLPSITPDFHCPSSTASPPLTESLTQRAQNETKCSLFSDSDEVGSTETPGVTLFSLSFPVDKDKPSTSPHLGLDSSKIEEGCLSPNPSIPVFQSSSSSQSHDNISLHLEDTLQRKGEGEGEADSHTDTVQTQDTVVYISDPESSAGLSEGSQLVSEVCNQTETDPHVPFSSLQDELLADTKQEELRKVCQKEVNSSESESPRNHLVLHDDIPKASSQATAHPKDLIEIASLDMVFETSVDGSDVEIGEVEDFFQQLDTEGQVFWAEPIQISNLEDSSSLETSDGSLESSLLRKNPTGSLSSTDKEMPLSSSLSETIGTDQTSKNVTVSSDTPSTNAPAPTTSLSTTPDLTHFNRSVSVQMSSSPSSHIVLRKDVPYTTDSKQTLPPNIIPLDTSTPFRAVQSWTDLHMLRNPLIKKLSQEVLDSVPNEVTLCTSASEGTQRPTQMFSSTPSFPLPSNDWQSYDCLPGMAKNYRTVSVSVDTGLSPQKETVAQRNVNKEDWEGNQMITMACCSSCNHQCTSCSQKSYNKQQTVGNVPYSLDELEELMLSLQQFCSVLSNMEEQLSEDQAAVYSALSDHEREKVRDIEELRRAVKQEARELEKQLNELAHHYDDSLKMKMHRLLDEQSLLCSQLRVFLPGASSPTTNRTVATQCSLRSPFAPVGARSDGISSWSSCNVGSQRKTSNELESICEGLGSSSNKADKMDIVGFLQKLKESLRHSANTDSIE
ncbi:Coiled-coil domain-containing protein 129 [Channa argus]|uniref:Coiled-coil domain-containing protein 129 n=1 Tax=Channa argus TaxID=215402 RepID=A0A6G1QL86_CHAAH|nr:Coiled-coil domain-containing protein 129 [Channa argus]